LRNDHAMLGQIRRIEREPFVITEAMHIGALGVGGPQPDQNFSLQFAVKHFATPVRPSPRTASKLPEQEGPMPKLPIKDASPGSGSFGLEIRPDGQMVALILPVPGTGNVRIELDASQAEQLHELIGKAVLLLGARAAKPTGLH
jgi:hypothetical protein